MSRLPFIACVELNVELLAAAEDIVVRDAENESRADVTVGFGCRVHLERRLDGAFEAAGYGHIKRGMLAGVDGHGLNGDVAEHTETRETCLRAVHIPDGENLTLSESDAGGNHIGTQTGGTHHNEFAAVGLDSIGNTGMTCAAAQNVGCDFAGAELLGRELGSIRRENLPDFHPLRESYTTPVRQPP